MTEKQKATKNQSNKNLTFGHQGAVKMEMYCKNIVKECHWTRTGECKATIPYSCDANLNIAQQQNNRKSEYLAERSAEIAASEAEG